MKSMDELMDMVCQELDDLTKKGTMNSGDLDAIYKLTMIKEKLMRIEQIEEEMGGYSQAGDWRAMGSYGRGYRDDYSGRRNSRGRMGRGYSYAEGRDEVMNRISEMMDAGGLDDRERQSLRRAMEDLR